MKVRVGSRRTAGGALVWRLVLNHMFERFALTSSVDDIAAALAAEATRATGWRISYRFGVGERVLIVRSAASQKPDLRELVLAKWGYIPSWNRGELKPVSSVGVERLSQNGVFRNAVIRSRCLIPMNGFFEWAHPPVGEQVPCFVQGPVPIIAAMGLFSVRRVGGREEVSVAFVTRDSPESRDPAKTVPAVLHQTDWASWLTSDPRTSVEQFVEPSPSTRALIDSLSGHRVSVPIAVASARSATRVTAPIFADVGCQ
ncbi:SOS response-associated peptidase family protein [Subtercola endophyticus]|uniref:SOS response-associated peptidase family protein n=1 Tax=Subtercola endophyticus TaxID=2895559 RepID=UPI0036F36656